MIESESMHPESSDNGIRLVNFATSKNLMVKSTKFKNLNIHKYTWLLSKILKIKIYKTITLPVVLYGCKPGLLH